jgi:hypothetical protein
VQVAGRDDPDWLVLEYGTTRFDVLREVPDLVAQEDK